LGGDSQVRRRNCPARVEAAQPRWSLCLLRVLPLDSTGGARRGAQHKSPVGGAERKASASDFWYDVAGWVCLAGIVTGWIALARNAAPATAPAVK